MALQIGSFGATAVTWFSTIIYWFIGLVTTVVMGVVVLYARRKKKLSYKVLEVTDLGNGKVGLNNLKAGWFKPKSFLGLYDYGGEPKMLTNDKREIYGGSSEFFQEIDGYRGMVVQRKSNDPKVLIPINSMKLDNESKELINTIAPADYRDASIKIMKQAEMETSNRFSAFLTQALPYIMVGMFILSLIFIIQYAKQSQAESWVNTLEAIKMAYENKGAVIASSTAP